MMDGWTNLATTGYGPISSTSRNQIQLFRIYYNIRSRIWKYNLTDIWFFLWKTAVLGQFSRINSSQIQVWRIHYLKTFRGRGRMMDGPINHWWRQDRDRFLVQEGIMSSEFKLTIHKAIKMSEPPVWSFPVSLYWHTISSHTFWIK